MLCLVSRETGVILSICATVEYLVFRSRFLHFRCIFGNCIYLLAVDKQHKLSETLGIVVFFSFGGEQHFGNIASTYCQHFTTTLSFGESGSLNNNNVSEDI